METPGTVPAPSLSPEQVFESVACKSLFLILQGSELPASFCLYPSLYTQVLLPIGEADVDLTA